jgi:hypothetical protein
LWVVAELVCAQERLLGRVDVSSAQPEFTERV